MKQKIIQDACTAIEGGNLTQAKSIISEGYPFIALDNVGRQYSDFQKTEIFVRDGFVDRYSGEKLLFPPVLRLLSG